MSIEINEINPENIQSGSLFENISCFSEANEAIQDLLRKPYVREILILNGKQLLKKGEKKLKPSTLTIPQLRDAAMTAIYLGFSAKNFLEELVWQAGEKKSYHKQFFVRKGHDFSLSPKLNGALYNELAQLFGKEKIAPEKLGVRYTTISMNKCAEFGNIRLMKHAWNMGVPVEEDTCMFAARAKSFECLKFAHQHGSDLCYQTFHAATADLQCLEYVLENRKCNSHAQDTIDMLKGAAAYGNMACVEKLFPFSDEYSQRGAIMSAANCGRLECLKFLVKNCPHMDYDEDTIACSVAASNGHLDCLKFLHEFGFSWDGDTCTYAAHGGHLDCLRYAVEQGCECNGFTMEEAAAGGHIEIVKFLAEQKISCTAYGLARCAGNGHLECLKFLHEEMKILFDERTCSYAAGNGHLECLRYAHENKAPWDRQTCLSAAENGHLECLKYAHENGAPWDTECATIASTEWHFDCLRYMIENGCPVTEEHRTSARLEEPIAEPDD